MQTTKELQPFTQLNNERHLSGYELTKLILQSGKALNLKPSELLVLTALSTYYNADNPIKAVFPSELTLANSTAQSVRTVQRAISQLVKLGYLLKSKRRNKTNANIYVINTHKISDIVSLQTRQIDTNKHDKLSHSCRTNKREKIREHHHEIEAPKPPKKIIDVDFSSNSHKKIILADVPEAIKNNKKILNPCAYWASLNEEEKKAILDKQNAELERAAKIQKIKDEAKAEQERQRAEEEAYNNLPVWERYTREKAIRTLYATKWYYNQKKQLNSFTREFVEYYKLNADKICTMTAEELENYIQETC